MKNIRDVALMTTPLVNENYLLLKKDTYLAMPIILVVILFFIVTALEYEPAISLLTLPIILSVPIIAAFYLYLGIKNIVYMRYKSAASLIVAIPLLPLALGLPIAGGMTNALALKTAYYIKLSLNEKRYLDEVKLDKPNMDGFRYKEFDWGGGFMLNPVYLVYDESDELELPQDRRSKIWWNKVGANYGENSEFARCQYGVHKIKQHFYVVNFSC
jgi:hypothetical protein